MDQSELFSVNGVEIFSTGVWNGKQIQEKDLDSIVESFGATNHLLKPHLKLGHSNDQKLLASEGLPVAGWVENVRKVGSKLVADFVDIPKQIYQLIKNKAYRKVSCEIYNNIDIEGNKYPKFLGAVALLGAELPGVMNLKDILANYYAMTSKFKTVETFTAENSMDIIKLLDPIEFSEIDGMEEQLKEALDKNKALQEQLDAFKAQMDSFKSDFDKMKSAKEDSEKALALAKKEKEEAEADKFVSDLQAEKLCSKAMSPLIKAALSADQVEKYSLDGKEYSRQSLIKQILKEAAESAKVNFSNATAQTDGDDGKLDSKKVEEYAKKHNVSFSEAYRRINKEG